MPMLCKTLINNCSFGILLIRHDFKTGLRSPQTQPAWLMAAYGLDRPPVFLVITKKILGNLQVDLISLQIFRN